ncbi:hypothetical protein SprV_0501902500 [Sparganum proliferum]
MQRGMDLFAAVCGNFGLIVNMEKTVVMHQPPPDAANVAPQIDAKLQAADNFTYLGSALSRNTKVDDEVAHRISNASQAFGYLQNTVWNRHSLDRKQRWTETWTVCKKQAGRLIYFHLSCLRGILKLRWQDRIPDTDVLERTGIVSICATLRQPQLGWGGHIVRMDDERLSKRLFYGDVATVSRHRGGQIRHYKDTLKTTLKRLQINSANWKNPARDPPSWRRTVKTGAAISGANRITAAKAKREARKSQLCPHRNVNAQPTHTYPPCQRTFRSASALTPTTNNDRTAKPPLPSSSSYSASSSTFSIASSSAAATPVPNTPAHNSDAPTNINRHTVNTSDVDPVDMCPH